MTFEQCAESFLTTNSVVWRNDRHRRQWRSTLSTYAFPVFGSLPVNEIDTALVVRALTPIWSTKAETANRVRGRVERVLAWAEAQNLRGGENPASWTKLKYLLPLKAKAKEHHPAMPYAELPGFMTELRGREYVSARALEFTILTASRTSEVTGAKWDEIDLDAGLWTIPADRMKANRPHQVPLSERAVSILRDLPRAGEHIFINGGGNPLSNMAMLQLLRGMKPGLTVHGFRATFKTWCLERTSYANEVQEAALAHAVADKVEAAYIRGDNMIDKRRRLMSEWARYCEAPVATGQVISIGAA
jgi:integrase